MRGEHIMTQLVPSYFEVEGYEIIVIQDVEGELITVKVIEYEK